MNPLARRRWILTGAVVAAVAVGGAGAGVAVAARPAPAAAGASVATGSTTVTKGDLVDSTLFSGDLGYGQRNALVASGGGTVTGLPAFGSTVHLGETLYEVDERPVSAFHGRIPVHREMARGMTGRDVQQLNGSLRALGFGDAPDSADFTSGTARAVSSWQESRGLPATGTVGAGQIAFVDGDVRVAGLVARVGSPTVGDVLEYTSTARVVTTSVSVRDSARFPVDQPVTVRLGDGRTLPGRVASQESATPADRPSSGGDDEPEVDVLIGFDGAPANLPAGEQAVDVNLPGEKATGVLSVPVSALVVGPDGGYRLETRVGGRPRFLPVKLGLFAQGRVAVTGAGVTEGLRVVVPA
jgi:peptidoglycan hydrolase-like protein with peptidoglycan-binding domain